MLIRDGNFVCITFIGIKKHFDRMTQIDLSIIRIDLQK